MLGSPVREDGAGTGAGMRAAAQEESGVVGRSMGITSLMEEGSCLIAQLEASGHADAVIGSLLEGRSAVARAIIRSAR